MIKPHKDSNNVYGGTGQDQYDVILVSMPFGPLFQPSIALSLLKSSLTQYGVTSVPIYL